MWSVKGGFQLEFESKAIGGKLISKINPLQDFLSSLNAVISTNENTEFITGHVIYNPAYTYKFQLKTTKIGNLTILTKKDFVKSSTVREPSEGLKIW